MQILHKCTIFQEIKQHYSFVLRLKTTRSHSEMVGDMLLPDLCN